MEFVVDATLELSTLREADAPDLFSLVDRNRAHLREWLPWLDVNTRVDDSLKFIREQTDKAIRQELIPFAVRSERQLVGVVSFNWIKPDLRSCGLGYWLAEHIQGRGVATRSVRALVNHAFSALDLQLIEIHIATHNRRSRALAERLGFVAGRIIGEAEWLYDHYVDHTVYHLGRGGAG